MTETTATVVTPDTELTTTVVAAGPSETLDTEHAVFLVDENGDFVAMTEEEFYSMLEQFFAEDDAEGQEIYLQLLGLDMPDEAANDNDTTDVAEAA